MFANHAMLDLFGDSLALGRNLADVLPEISTPLVQAPDVKHVPLTLQGAEFIGQLQALSHKGQGSILVLRPRDPSC